MELYTHTCYQLSKQLTDAYSTSFSWSIRLFPKERQQAVYSLYSMVRLADEIVDTYRGNNTSSLLESFINDVYAAVNNGYSTNPIVHAFAHTARRYNIDRTLIAPFFESMRADLATPHPYTEEEYRDYIYGSAEVIGLMILRLFVSDNDYHILKPAARSLGAAYQKVNFLRDIHADHSIGRWYFPDTTYRTFNEHHKRAIVADIHADFTAAQPAIQQLPKEARKAVTLSYRYYRELLRRIERTPVSVLKKQRIRVPNSKKVCLLLQGSVYA